MDVDELRAKIRDIKDFPTEGILFKDITTLLRDGPAWASVIDHLAARYHTAPHPKLGPTNPDQDAVEIALARRAVADGKPALGVCRGVQLLNVALGGTLYQDICSEIAMASTGKSFVTKSRS